MPFKDEVRNRMYQRMWARQKYRENPHMLIDARKRNRARLKAYVNSVKMISKCKNCEESDHRCLDFHHKNPLEKSFAICWALRQNVGINKLKLEIEKCEILCRNCHAKLHVA